MNIFKYFSRRLKYHQLIHSLVGNCSDTGDTAPTFGGSLSLSNIGPRSAEVTWSPASDIWVSNYQVFINGSSVTCMA